MTASDPGATTGRAAASRLPDLPSLPAEMIQSHHDAHRILNGRLAAEDPLTIRLFRYLQVRLNVESLATVWSVRPMAASPMLFPPRRRFLTSSFVDRVRGCTAAFRHIDSRLAMWRVGHVEHAVGTETPFVLNALGESANPDRRETNPGLPRATDSGFDETNSAFTPALPQYCESLLSEAIDVANDSSEPAVTRAGWLALIVFAVHPFVDGNGRTARLLFMLLNSTDPDVVFDWGSSEYWANNRDRYLVALQACTDPSAPAYHADKVEVLPFMRFTCERSRLGAELASHRLTAIERELDRAAKRGLDDRHALIDRAIALDRNATLDDLTELVDEPLLTAIVNDLVAAGHVRWDAIGRLHSTVGLDTTQSQ